MNTPWQRFWNINTPDKERNAWWIGLGSLVLFTFLGILSYVSRISAQYYLPSPSTVLSFMVVIILAVSFWLIHRKQAILGSYGVLLAWNVSNYTSFIFTRPVSGIEYASITAIILLALAYFLLPSKPHFRILVGLIALANLGFIVLDVFLAPLTPSTTPQNPIRSVIAYAVFGLLVIFVVFYFGRLGWQMLTREAQVARGTRPSEAQLLAQEARNTVRVFILIVIVYSLGATNAIVTLLRSGQFTPNFVFIPFNLVALSIAGWFIWRQRHQLAATIFTVLLYVALTANVLNLRDGYGGSLIAIFVFTFPLASAAYTLPPRQIPFWVLVSSGAAIVAIVLDVLLPINPTIQATPPALIAVAAIIVVIVIALILRQFNLYPFDAKVILALTTTTALLALIIGIFAIFQSAQTQAALSQELQSSVQQTAETQLGDTVRIEATNIDNELGRVRTTVEALAQTMSNLYAQEDIFAKGDYWDASKKLTRLPTGQYDNPDTDPSSVYVPFFVPINNATISELNTSAQLDFIAPQLLKANPSITAIYFITTNGATRYYPNANIAALVPSDFDPSRRAYFENITPVKNPGHKGVWAEPYQDETGLGLVMTFAYPVYDQRGVFRGAIATDITLGRITQRLKEIKVGRAGYAFLIDQKGTVMAMPAQGYSDFDFQPAVTFTGGPLQTTLLGKGSAELQEIVQKMILFGQSGIDRQKAVQRMTILGENRLDRVDIKGVKHYIAHTVLLDGDYSLGLVESYDDLNSVYIAANQNLERTAIQNRQLTALLIAIVVLLAALFSIGLTRLLVTPITRLTRVAERVSSGDLNARAAIETQDEIGTLAFTFNSMTSQLQETLTGLENRVADRTHALAASAEVSRRLSTILDQRQLVTEVVEQVRTAFNYYHAHIYLFDDKQENLLMVGGTGDVGQKMLLNRHQIPKGRGLVGRAADLNVPVLVPDTAKDPQWLPNPLLPDTKAEAAVPIALGNRVLGVLDVQHNVVNGLKQEDVDLLLSIANQVAIALQNTRAITQAQHQAEYESLLGTITQKIRETNTVESAMQVAIRELGRATGAAHTVVKLDVEKPTNGNSQ